eukprot:TRINITY_DN7313_c0_g1_i1.p2 TRINITY_DN7313_c0_g1~~TRINITY_DN7313_c0_g1_i1.p2  ORF type:complete len:146 (-),score=21.14 TRINITY_DN7313_c0_g1_i1:117-554(-)
MAAAATEVCQLSEGADLCSIPCLEVDAPSEVPPAPMLRPMETPDDDSYMPALLLPDPVEPELCISSELPEFSGSVSFLDQVAADRWLCCEDEVYPEAGQGFTPRASNSSTRSSTPVSALGDDSDSTTTYQFNILHELLRHEGPYR